jgi:cyclophilin family peptidyl-prolyl cis-trans isomerase
MISVKTTRGNILLELYKRQAPASVCNFIGLLREGFFNGRVFHRIVPNFVIQTGCPRGDGYGSLDYSIRSELPQYYYNRSGLVGMASAGRHTEGTQWFITHSATPHLDGRYTLFGRVTDGMDVVNSMEQGDKIVEVLLIK